MHPPPIGQFIRPCYENYTAVLFLDEAGDSGCRLDRPYQAGGDSPGLAMAGLLVRRGPDASLWEEVERAFLNSSHLFSKRVLKWKSLGPRNRKLIAIAMKSVFKARKTYVHPHVVYIDKMTTPAARYRDALDGWLHEYLPWPTSMLKDGDRLLIQADADPVWTDWGREHFCRCIEDEAAGRGISVKVEMQLVMGRLHVGTQVAGMIAGAVFTHHASESCLAWDIIDSRVPMVMVQGQ